MRLLIVDSFFSIEGSVKLQYFVKPPESYAILSHTWGQDEVVFEDISRGTAPERSAYRKLLFAAEQASRDEYRYLWVDTCCIDKSSSAELQEAINSMFRYYRDSTVCYIYLEDVAFSFQVESTEFETEFTSSRWFTRGWTLQELVAPKRLLFFSRDWRLITDTSRGWNTMMDPIRWHWTSHKDQERRERRRNPRSASTDRHLAVLDRVISLVAIATGISERYLTSTNGKPLARVRVALKMFWASSRHTSREEDAAYCLLGLFDVSMPLLYGEGGQKAFLRLQEEIMKQSDDHSLFAWTRAPEKPSNYHGRLIIEPHGLLADRPSDFSDRSMAAGLDVYPWSNERRWSDTDPYYLTSRGLQIRLHLQHIGATVYMAVLDCTMANEMVAIYLVREDENKPFFQRIFPGTLDLVTSPKRINPLAILVRQRLDSTHRPPWTECISYSVGVSTSTAATFVLSGTSKKNFEQGVFEFNPQETWKTLSEKSFGNNPERDISLLVDHVYCRQRLIVSFNSLRGSVVGFGALEAIQKSPRQKIQSRFRFIQYKQAELRLHIPGKVVDVQTQHFVYHVKVEVLKSEMRESEVRYPRHHFHLHLRLSIETSSASIPQWRVEPPELAIGGGDDRAVTPDLLNVSRSSTQADATGAANGREVLDSPEERDLPCSEDDVVHGTKHASREPVRITTPRRLRAHSPEATWTEASTIWHMGKKNTGCQSRFHPMLTG